MHRYVAFGKRNVECNAARRARAVKCSALATGIVGPHPAALCSAVGPQEGGVSVIAAMAVIGRSKKKTDTAQAHMWAVRSLFVTGPQK